MPYSAAKTRLFIIQHAILSLLMIGASGAVTWGAEPDASDPPFVGPVHLDDSSLPDPYRTPGDWIEHAKRKDLCDDDSRQRVPMASLCDSVFSDYRIPSERRFQYQCSYLVPLGIGGAATQLNVWPQPAAEAAFKEAIDVELHKQICSEDISPAQAQREIAGDWVKTYRRYILVNDPPPLVIESRASDEPVNAPAAITPPAAQGGGPSGVTPGGAFPDRPRSNSLNGPKAAPRQGAQGSSAVPAQRPDSSGRNRPAMAAVASPRRAMTFAQRRVSARIRNIAR